MRQPVGRVDEPFGEQIDIEAQVCRARVNDFFMQRQQIDQQRRQLCFVQHPRHITIAGAVPAASAAMREQHNCLGILRQV